ncbi:MAG: UDP-N-acetylmuramoyl-L-alanine--D-glutamate ligase [Lentisphaerales bacterium]|nr:UDP-N-acetylmuramoyl-L-alanine--D-glutamate ligase [Lentisphaerales bacterium]
MKKIIIAGLGVSGYEAARLALLKKIEIVVLELYETASSVSRAKELEALGASVSLGPIPEGLRTSSYDYVVISPGIHPQQEFGAQLYSWGLPVISELEFASKFCNVPLIGITGTNGKTTTVELITHCLNTLGKKAIAAGNIGYALSRVVREAESWDYIVVEVSSFQLEAIEAIQFISGALLNVSSDHIDRYTSFAEYAAVKLKLINHSKYKTVSVSTEKYFSIEPAGLKKVDYSGQSSAAFTLKERELLSTPESSFLYKGHPLKGLHNAENLLSCLSVLSAIGFGCKEIYESSLSFKTASHRLQFFLKERGIIFINDSKATNPDALRMALESCGSKEAKNIILIAGGRDKKMDFKVVNSALCSYVKKLYIYGECRQTLKEAWQTEIACEIYEDFTSSVKAALSIVEEGDILLLSPGCSSLDSFKNYGERGNKFMELVQEWTKR